VYQGLLGLCTWCRLTFLLGVCTLIGACALERLEPLAAKTQPNAAGDAGYLLVSITREAGSNAWVEYRPLSGESRPLNARGVGFFASSDDFKDDETRSGRLMFIELESGHYELTNWRLVAHSAIHNDRAIGPAALPGIPFFIHPGEVTYVGNAHVDVVRQASGLPVEFQALVNAGITISDRSTRDVAMFRERYVEFANVPVRVNVKTDPEWDLRVQLAHE